MDDFEMKIPKGNGCGGVGGTRGNGRGGSNQPNHTNNPWKRSFKAKVTSIYGKTKKTKEKDNGKDKDNKNTITPTTPGRGPAKPR